MCLEGKVGEKSVIAQRDGKADREEHHKEETDLEPVDPEEPEVDRHRGNRKEQGADEK